MRRVVCVVAFLGAGCGPEALPDGVRFVRGGLVHPDGRVEARAWTPGESVGGRLAPREPECAPLFQVELEDQTRLAVTGAPPPGAALAFSPDGTRLAIGSIAGSLRVVDAWTGAEISRLEVGEGAVKRVAWAPDGRTLYAGEQSPDAYVLALDAETLATRWRVRLADELETSPLPPDEDIYGRYALPAVFALLVQPDGTLLVGGAHGWTDASGVRRNLSRMYRYAPDGTRLAAWPPERAADAVMLFPSVAAGTALVGVSRSADGPAPPELPVGGLLELELATLSPRWSTTFPVLAPHFREVFLWEAVVAGEGFRFAGLGDGRAVLHPRDGAPARTLEPGVPVLSAGVPIATGVGFAAGTPRGVVFATTSTNIPWGSADPSARPPSAHPAQNTLHAIGPDGGARWERSFEHALEGVVASPDGSTLLVGASTRATDTRLDLFGALLVADADGAPVTTCSTEGPVDSRPVWGPDNLRVAVAEAPFLVEGAPRGAYRVTVFR